MAGGHGGGGHIASASATANAHFPSPASLAFRRRAAVSTRSSSSIPDSVRDLLDQAGGQHGIQIVDRLVLGSIRDLGEHVGVELSPEEGGDP